MAIRARLSVLLIASAFALVGCGGGSDSDGEGSKDDISDLSATEILAKAKKQLAAEDSVTVKGKGKDEETEIEIDMGFAGDTASGTLAVDGAEFELLGAAGKAYFKASDEFYRANAGEGAEQLIALIDGRWVLADASDPDFKDMASFVAKDEFFSELLDPDGKITKGDDKTIDGVECVALKDDSDGVFYFDKSDGKPISLVTNDDGGGTLTFSYDDVDEALAPTDDEVVDLSKLG